LGDSGKMKLYVDPFLVNVADLEGKKVLVWTYKAETTMGKQVVVSDELRNHMIKSKSLEVGVWKENIERKIT
jgi:hypothetical protein